MFVSHSVLHHMICLSYCRKWKCFLWRLSKWFLNVHFWVNYPFNINLHTCTVWYVCFNTLALFYILPTMFPCDRQCIYFFFFFFLWSKRLSFVFNQRWAFQWSWSIKVIWDQCFHHQHNSRVLISFNHHC